MKKVRYAVVGAGWISQEAFMPSVFQTGNSEIAAIVSGNAEKAKILADFHGVPAIYAYDQYDAMLASGAVDAVYIAVPNSQHADYAIRAARADWQHAAYSLARLTNYCGHWVRHGGWYPDRKLRLYDRRLGRWTGLLLHEKFEVSPGQTTAPLTGDALHYSYPSIAQHVAQLNKFTSITAQELALHGRPRVTLFHLLLKPLWKFGHGYVFRLGFLDGFAGLCIAGISAWGVFLKFAKLKTRTEQAEA